MIAGRRLAPVKRLRPAEFFRRGLAEVGQLCALCGRKRSNTENTDALRVLCVKLRGTEGKENFVVMVGMPRYLSAFRGPVQAWRRGEGPPGSS